MFTTCCDISTGRGTPGPRDHLVAETGLCSFLKTFAAFRPALRNNNVLREQRFPKPRCFHRRLINLLGAIDCGLQDSKLAQDRNREETNNNHFGARGGQTDLHKTIWIPCDIGKGVSS